MFPRPARSAFGLIEALVAFVLFAVIFIPLMGVFTDTGGMQMEVVRDYAAVLNVSERFLNNSLDILESGRTDLAGDLEITALLEGDPYARNTLQGVQRLRAWLSVAAVPGNPRLFRVTLRFSFGQSPQRTFELSTLKYAPDC